MLKVGTIINPDTGGDKDIRWIIPAVADVTKRYKYNRLSHSENFVNLWKDQFGHNAGAF